MTILGIRNLQRGPKKRPQRTAPRLELFTVFLDLVKLEDLFMAPLNPYVDIIIHQASPERYRQVLERIRNTGITNLIIDTDKDRIDLLLRNVSETLR